MRVILKFSFVAITALIVSSCYTGDSPKFYDYYVINELTISVKIVPEYSQNFNFYDDFWITKVDTFTILSGQKAIIGSQMLDNDDKRANDIYSPDEFIASFELLVDGEIRSEEFEKRSYWTFERGSNKETGIYVLTINDESLED